MEKKKSKIVWIIIFAILIALTISTIIRMSSSFTAEGFADYIKNAHPFWMICAILCTFLYIFLEGVSIRYLSSFFKSRFSMAKGLFYSSANLYFSAITPSATGGQPACAYFMVQDGIPASVTAMTLLINITLYTVSIVIIGFVSLVISPTVFAGFDTFSRMLIIAGFIVQIICIAVFLLLVYRDQLMLGIAKKVLNILKALHLIKDVEKKHKKLEMQAIEYKECAKALNKNAHVGFVTLGITLVQRLMQIGATVCVYIATGGSITNVIKVIAAQGFIILGSNAVPMPGGVGVADYLFFDGYKTLVSGKITELELLARGVSFYSCVIICIVVIITGIIVNRIKKRRAG